MGFFLAWCFEIELQDRLPGPPDDGDFPYRRAGLLGRCDPEYVDVSRSRSYDLLTIV